MAKRRKKTHPVMPARGRMRDIADRLWSWAVRDDWAWKCAVCGFEKTEAHHLVPRHHEGTRYTLRNGIGLCARCHKFDKDMSPHENAAGWLSWLRHHHPELCEWYEANRSPAFDGIKNAAYYCGIIRDLKQYVDDDEYVRIVGVKFAAWLGSE